MLMQIAAHPGWNDGDAPAFWPIFPAMFGLFWLAVIGGAFYLTRRNWRTGHQAAATEPQANARKILAERFARGEIDEDEYYTKMAVLRQEP